MQKLGENEPYPNILYLQAMKILADSWKTITKETVINYLEKAGIKLTFKRLPLLIQIINLTHFRQMFHLFINQIAGFY